MQIETYLIDINEEMYAISEELAKAFINSNLDQETANLTQKAKDYDKRKISLLKRIQHTLQQEPIAKFIRKYVDMNSRSRSVSPVDFQERSKSNQSKKRS